MDIDLCLVFSYERCCYKYTSLHIIALFLWDVLSGSGADTSKIYNLNSNGYCQMANKHEKMLYLLVIREMQINVTKKHDFTPIRLEKCKRDL